jgi:hypothetical protein
MEEVVMSRFDEFEPDLDYYDQHPEEDPFEEDDEYDFPRDAGDLDWAGYQAESELEFKDGVTERLLEVIEEYLGFSTKTELLTLINNNF